MKAKYLVLFFLNLMIGVFAEAQTYVTVYTPYNKPVEGILRDEFTQSEIELLNNEYIRGYPQATFLANASRTYNCHSYAWNLSTGGSTTCWINQFDHLGNANISKYWSENSYVETNESSAYKIFYYDGDHSATRSSVPGFYESKWGSAPLMRHAPNYGPSDYKMSNRQYYVPKVAVSGPTILYLTDVSVSGQFTASPTYKSVVGNYNWSVTGPGNPRIYPNGEYAGGEFFTQGIYYMECVFTTNTGQSLVSSRFKVTVRSSTYSLFYDSSTKVLALIESSGSPKIYNKNSFPYQIINLTSGILVDKGNLNSHGDQISLATLSAGIYTFSVQIDEETVLTKKIVVQ